jgi:hypothetical protein
MKYSITAMVFVALLAACSVKSERTVQTTPVATTTTTAVPAATTTVTTPAVPATTTVVTR